MYVAELNPCGPLMGRTILVKQGQFVLRGRCAIYMHHWLCPLSLPRLYGIDAYLIRCIAELNPCGPLMDETVLLKQGQFVLRDTCVTCMRRWLHPLSLVCMGSTNN